MKLAKRNEIGLVHYEQEDAEEIYEEVEKVLMRMIQKWNLMMGNDMRKPNLYLKKKTK